MKPAIGSSPRTWGTLPHDARGLDLDRFIPTHVGNAQWHYGPTAAHTVHPHARGERYMCNPADDDVAGSSPRTWGTPEARRSWVSVPRTHLSSPR